MLMWQVFIYNKRKGLVYRAFIDTLEWTTALLYGSLQGLCNVAGVLNMLKSMMRAQTAAGQNNN